MPLTVQEHNRQLGQPPLCEQLKVRDPTERFLCGWLQGKRDQLVLRERRGTQPHKGIARSPGSVFARTFDANAGPF